MMPFKKLFLPLVILTFLGLSPLSHTSMHENNLPYLLEAWKGRLLKTGELLISNEGNLPTCVSTLKNMSEDLEREWGPTLSYRNALLKKLKRPVPDTPLFNFDHWSEEFNEDPSSGIKQGVIGISEPLEALVSTIDKLLQESAAAGP